MELNNKTRSYIGFAVKAGKVKYGYDNITSSKSAPKLILLYDGAAERTVKNTQNYAAKTGCQAITISEPPVAGRDCKVLGIYEPELAKAIIKENNNINNQNTEGN